ncbi:hypothetical protein [Paenisporosarcina sp. NPDC076898]|uniref:hypothetical protein n=1 Tax=unclassified Paenisporosarcina TaxID=2642018 RepID=UPI003D01EEA3
MRGIILGGGTFIGHWMKKKLAIEFGHSPVIIDYPRENIRIYLSANDMFYSLSEINFKALEDYRPDYIVFNFYDLFDLYSINLSKSSDNILMSVINKLLEIVRKINCRLLILTHVNRYRSINTFYESMFNSLNDTYLKYIEVVAKTMSIDIKIILLPNVFGPRESNQAIISTIFSKILNHEDLQLIETKRDFLFVDSVINRCFNDFFITNDKNIYYSYSSGRRTSLVEMYSLIIRILGKENKKNKISILKDSIFLEKTDVNSDLIKNIVINQDYGVIFDNYKNFFK